MGNMNTGSIVVEVHKRVDNIPTVLSGTNMNNDVDRAIAHVEEYTGLSIGNTAITPKYQNAVIYKTCIDVLSSIKAFGSNGGVSLGDFSTNEGTGDNVANGIQTYTELLKMEKTILGKKFNWYKSNS